MPSAESITEFFRGIYQRAEDAFYSALDWLDAHNVPVYSVHDWLEDRGIPPFPAFLAVLFIIIAVAGLAILPGVSETYNVTIRVVDEDGSPVPNATVRIWLGDQYLQDITDSDGYAYFLDVPQKPEAVSVSADGFKPVDKKPLTGLESTITLEYQAGEKMEICVRPLDSETGYTAKGVSVVGTYTLYGEPASKAFEYDDVYGVYCAEFPSGTSVDVTVSGGDYETATKTVSSPYSKEDPLEFTVFRSGTSGGLKSKGYEVTVHVLYDGVGIPAEVKIRRDNGTETVEDKYTDDNGFVTLNVPEAGRYVLGVIARGEYFGWTAVKTIIVPDDSNVEIDVYKEGADTGGVLGDYNDLTKITSKPSPDEENVPEEFNVTICPYDERTGAYIPNATVKFGAETNTTGKNGCVTFYNVKPMDTPYPLYIEAGDEYLPFNGTLAVGGSATFPVKMTVRDARPSIEFLYYEMGGLELLGPPAGKRITLHFRVTLPYHIESAEAVFTTQGVPGFVLTDDPYTVDLSDKKGSTTEVEVPVTVEEVENAFLQYTLKIKDVNGNETSVGGNINPEILKTVLHCGDGRTALRFVVSSDPIIVGKPTTITVYAGSCDANVAIADVTATVNGTPVSLGEAGGTDRYTVYVGTFTVPEENKDRRAKVDVRLLDGSGNVLNRRFKYFDVAETVGTFYVKFDAPFVKEGNEWKVFRNYAGKMHVCAASKVADRMDVSVELEEAGKAKTMSGTVELGEKAKCFTAEIQPSGEYVRVTAKIYRGKELLDTVVKEYPVVDHMNDVKICVRDVDTGDAITAKVDLYGKMHNYSFETNSDGCYETEVGDDTYSIRINAGGYLPLELDGVEIKSGHFEETYDLYRPVKDPVLEPDHIKNGSGQIVAAVTPGKTYKVFVRLTLPPRIVSGRAEFHATSHYSETDLVKNPVVTVSPSDSNKTVLKSFEIRVPETQGFSEPITVEYDVNVLVQTNLGSKEYRTDRGTIAISVVPKEMVCGQNEGYAVIIVPLDDEGLPKDNILPPPRGVHEVDRRINVYYAPCKGGDVKTVRLYRRIGARTELLGDPQTAAPLDKFIAAHATFTLHVTDNDIGKKVFLSASVSDGLKVVGRSGEKEFRIGRKICVDVWTDPEVPVEGEVTIYALPKDCETGSTVKEDIAIYIKGGSAITEEGSAADSRASPLKWDGKAFKAAGTFSAGSIYLECYSGTHACELSPNVIFVYPAADRTLEIEGPSTVYVQEDAPMEYEYIVKPKGGVSNGAYQIVLEQEGKSTVNVHCDGVSAEVVSAPRTIGPSGGKVVVRFMGGKGECTLTAAGYLDIPGLGRKYYKGAKEIKTSLSALNPVIHISVPDTLYTGSEYYFQGNVTLKDVSPDAWNLRVRANASCAEGDVSVSVLNENQENKSFELHVKTGEEAKDCAVMLEAIAEIGRNEIRGTQEAMFDVESAEDLPVSVELPGYVNLIDESSTDVSISVNSKSGSIPVTLQFSVEGQGIEVGKDRATVVTGETLNVSVKRTLPPDKIPDPATLRVNVLAGKAFEKQVRVYASAVHCLKEESVLYNDTLYLKNSCPFDLKGITIYSRGVKLDGKESLTLDLDEGGVKEITLAEPKDEITLHVRAGDAYHGSFTLKNEVQTALLTPEGTPIRPVAVNDYPFGKDISCTSAYCGKRELGEYLAEKIMEAVSQNRTVKESVLTKDVDLYPSEDILAGTGLDHWLAQTVDSCDDVGEPAANTLYYTGEDTTQLKAGRHEVTITPLTNKNGEPVAACISFENVEEFDDKDLSVYRAAIHLNLGRYKKTESGWSRVEVGPAITVDKDHPVDLTIPGAAAEKVMERYGGEYAPFVPVREGESAEYSGSIVLSREDCPVSGVIARIDSSEDGKTFEIHLCSEYLDSTEEDRVAEDVANIIAYVFSFGRKGGMSTFVHEGQVYVTSTSSGAGWKDEYVAYIAPGAETTVTLPWPPFNPPIGMKYNVSVTYGNESCKPNLKLDGQSIGSDSIELKPAKGGGDNHIKLSISGADGEGCRTGSSAVISIEPAAETKNFRPFAYIVSLKPVSLRFEELVRATTCPDFDLDKLDIEVPATVLKFALGEGGEKCAAKPSNSGVVDLGNGWTVRKSGGSVVAEHKAGTDTTTETDVTIKWPDGFRVWVNKASKEEVKAAVDQATQNKEPEYLLKVEVVDPTTGIPQYTKETSKTKAMMAYSAWSRKTVAIAGAYTAACAAGVTACEAIQFAGSGGLSFAWSWKNLAYELPGCAIGGLLGAWTISLLGAADSKSWAGASILSMLAPMYLEARQYSTLGKGASSWIFRYAIGPLKPTLTKAYLAANWKQTVTDTFEEILDILKNARSTAPGVNYKDLPTYAFFGFDSEREWTTFLQTLQKEGGDNGKAIAARLSSPNRKTIGELSADDIKDLWNALEQAPEGSKLKNYANQIKKFSEKPESIVKRYGKEYRKQISFKKGLFCSAIGGLIGTSLAYGVFHTSASYDQITVDVCSNYSGEPVSIKVSSTHITSRHATIDACGAEKMVVELTGVGP